MVAKIRRGDTGNIAEIKTQSAEAELLARGFRGFNEKVDRLEQANDKFSNQVLPSLKSELFSGRTPPYFFECTMVRTDINGFSHIFNTHDTNVFMAHINEFFTEVSHIVSRYGGFIHEFVGDEVIYYFKDEHHANSFAVALGALADIQRAAEVLNQKTRTQNSYGFSVKSSLSHGSLRFGPLVNGYTLAGSVLIESVRVLSQVAEKDQNVIYFDQANLMRIAGVGRAEVALKAHLKGFDGERTLYRFEGHAPLAEVLAAPQVDAAKLSFYRSGRDLAQIFDWLRVYGESVDEATVASVIRTLRGVNVTRASYEFSQALFLWLETVAADFSRSRDLRHARVLSAAALLVRNLIPKAEFNDEIDARVEQFLAVDDKRVVANVLEALTEFRIDRDKNFVVGLLSSNDHRVQANAFIHRGIREIDRDLTVRLRKAIFGKDFHAAASALYALGEIVAFHYQRDSVYLQAQVDFYQLVESLPKLVLSSDAMVRRQSLIAARKSNDAKVQAAIRALVDRSDTLREEIKIHWSAIDSQAAATTGNAAPASAA
jgi:hypothetical protein